MPATTIVLVSVLISMILSPEIKGHVYSADVMVTYAKRTPPILVGGENSMGALTAMQSHQTVIAETLVSWSPRRKVGHLGSNSQHRGELNEPARPVSVERESGIGDRLGQHPGQWHRSGADIAAAGGAATATPMDRTILPIPEPKPPTIDVLDARNVIPPGRFEVKAPSNAPNVLVVLLDDMGFGQSSAFGGPVNMPALERLANEGLRYNQFHTTALCSPTRTALLTGRNHHMNNMGGIAEVATAFPGNTGVRPNAIAPLAETLRLNGYGTAAFGKYHETPPWEVSPVGPFDRWPTRSGFDKFYGFITGETNQWAPSIYDGTVRVEPPRNPDYHFMADMADQAINWMRSVKALAPDKPFFMYFAPGAMHAPLHVPKEWIAKYKGRFDAGWDKLREETLAKQIALGVVPQGTKLAPKPEFIKDWDSLSADEKRLFARQMEVFAGFGEYTDHEIGRLVQAIADQGQLDNTLVLYVVGDNGASAEGGANGLFNEFSYFNGFDEPLEVQLERIDLLGGPMAFNHYAAGWAVAGDAPFTWTKQIASSYGGTRNPLVVHWPNGIKAKNEVRSQWHHVVDVAQTILEAAGLPEPKSVNGTEQIPMQGVSMVYSFDDPSAPDRHLTQYFEIIGNRAIYHDGWLAGTVHKAPWEVQPRASLANDKWELYDTRVDFSLVNDLAADQSCQIERDAGSVHESRHRKPCSPNRRQVYRATECGGCGPPGSDGRPHLSDGVSRHVWTDGERLHQHKKPLILDHGRGADTRFRRIGRDPGTRRTLRRVEPLASGRSAKIYLQLARYRALRSCRRQSDAAG